MSAQQQFGKQDDRTIDAVSRDSSSPLIEKGPADTSKRSDNSQASESIDSADNTTKPRKRDFWKLGRKQEDETQKIKPKAQSGQRPSASHIAPIVGLRPNSPLRSSESAEGATSPHRWNPQSGPGSPAQNIHGNSPRPHSPASSMIFERNVQEDVLPPELSPSIPSHVITENHIPPALDASTEAITNQKLDPDTVEIVTHATHQPAALTITGVGAEQSLASSMHDDFANISRHDTDNASNYGSLDSTDVRRLSFISFADVVHGEQELGDQRRDSTHLVGHHSIGGPRSPSPIRSPVSSQAFGTSPPTSVSASVKGHEASPSRGVRGAGSPLPGQISPLGGELNIETMSQALRRTGSGDLSGFRSAPMSAVGNDDGTFERPFK